MAPQIDQIQAIINEMNRQNQEKRSHTQMTLGQVIEQLQNLPLELEIRGLGKLHSYRGYYCDLAFDPTEVKLVLVEKLLQECNNAMGKIFIGYKGGEFMMGETTPIWVAEYGCCGEKLMAINSDGSLILEDDD